MTLSHQPRPTSPIELLLVEDSEADAFLTRETFREARVTNRLHHVRDGVEALRFLRQEGAYAATPAPDVILLDLNMPRMSGHELLQALKRDPALAGIPVVILSMSDADHDVLRSYDLQASCYLTKPVAIDKFIDVMQSLDGFGITFIRRRSA